METGLAEIKQNKQLQISCHKTIKENISLSFFRLSKLFFKDIDDDFLVSWFALAQEDINRSYFTWEQFETALSRAIRNTKYFPSYSQVYEIACQIKKSKDKVIV